MLKTKVIFYGTWLGVLLNFTSWAHAECTPVQQVRPSSWSDLDDALPALELLQGSYLGKGLLSEQPYRLHLLQFLQNEDQFIAVIESEKMNFGQLGVIKKSTDGSYQWFGVGADSSDLLHPISPSESSQTQLSVGFGYVPLGDLEVLFDKNAKVESLELRFESPEIGPEVRIRFDQARAPLMRGELSIGTFRDEQGSTTVVPQRMSVESPGACLGQSSGAEAWSIKVLADASVDRFLGRMELPGVVALRQIQNGSRALQYSSMVTGVMVSLLSTSQFLFFECEDEQILMFLINPQGQVVSTPQRRKRVQ